MGWPRAARHAQERPVDGLIWARRCIRIREARPPERLCLEQHPSAEAAALPGDPNRLLNSTQSGEYP